LRLNKSPQKSDKNNKNNNFNVHRNILNAPNGRFPNSTGNGLEYKAQLNTATTGLAPGSPNPVRARPQL